MPFEKKTPLAVHPEVQKNPEYQEYLKMEKLAVNYDMKREELLALAGEARQFLTYGNIVHSPEFKKWSQELKESKKSIESMGDEAKKKLAAKIA